MYSRNILIAEKQVFCFQSKTVKICRFFFLTTIYIYLKRYFEKIVTNDFFSIFGRTAALNIHTFVKNIFLNIRDLPRETAYPQFT